MARNKCPGPHFVGSVGNLVAAFVEPEAGMPEAAVEVGIEVVGHVTGLGAGEA